MHAPGGKNLHISIVIVIGALPLTASPSSLFCSMLGIARYTRLLSCVCAPINVLPLLGHAPAAAQFELMVIYSQNALDATGWPEREMEINIALRVTEMNRAFKNSLINLEIHLTRTESVRKKEVMPNSHHNITHSTPPGRISRPTRSTRLRVICRININNPKSWVVDVDRRY